MQQQSAGAKQLLPLEMGCGQSRPTGTEHRLGEPDYLGSHLYQVLASYVNLGKLLGPSVPVSLTC